MLISGDWSDWSHFHFTMLVMPYKEAFASTVLLCVQQLTEETAIFTAPKGHLVTKNEFAFSFRPMRKDQQVGGQYANVSC